ncbi:MAG: beta-propeller domain-containing protein [Dethiobacteria bacterium]|jgi:inhibitor of cysteine peptidase
MEEKYPQKKWWWFLVFAALPVLAWGMLLLTAAAHQAAAQGVPVTVNEEEPNAPQKVSTTADLPVVGSFTNLQKLLEKAHSTTLLHGGRLIRSSLAVGAGADAAVDNSMSLQKSAQQTPAPAAEAEDYATTNLQVEGVDEADIVKTDGQYLYQVNKGRIIIARAYPPGEMKICSTLQFNDTGFTPRELYVDHNRLVVIGTAHQEIPVQPMPKNPQEPLLPQSQKSIAIYPPPPYRQSTLKTIIFDISNKENVRQLREIELEGHYVSSRKIGPALYLVANKSVGDYWIMPADAENSAPSYRDTAIKEDFIKIGYDRIRYFPGFLTPNYLLVAGLNLEKSTAPVKVQTYLGASENIYASLEHLYVAVANYGSGDPEIKRPPSGPDTMLYKFALDNGTVAYTAQGKVPGTVLNQFSMDEYKEHLRLATTTGSPWGSGEEISKNNVYILDPELQITGRVEDLAPGEKIYAARFLGEKGYMVTFRTVDPLFVIDLQDPQKPRLLGALKIPGYSDYLHPYDENHLLGFGKETMEIPQKDHQGSTIGSTIIDLGMKLSLFDVSDVQNPVEKFKTTIGGRGTHSELLQNHKALLWSKDKNLLAFPLTVMETKSTTPQGIPGYGEFTFQGAYIYNIDMQKGFQLKGKITHLDKEDYLKAGHHWYDSDKNVERILYINDTLYTLSPSRIKANTLANLQEIGSLHIP